MRRFAVALAVGVALVVGRAAGQNGDQGQLSYDLRAIEEAAAKKDIATIAAKLRDESWIVRARAVDRLRWFGLDATHTQPLARHARPGSAAPAAGDVHVAAATKVGTPARGRPPTEDVSAIIVGVLTDALADADVAASKKIAAILALRDLGLDEIFALGELAKDDDLRAVAPSWDAVGEWYADNEEFLYVHPADQCLRVDKAARKAEVATPRYRMETPWPESTGPKAPRSAKRALLLATQRIQRVANDARRSAIVSRASHDVFVGKIDSRWAFAIRRVEKDWSEPVVRLPADVELDVEGCGLEPGDWTKALPEATNVACLRFKKDGTLQPVNDAKHTTAADEVFDPATKTLPRRTKTDIVLRVKGDDSWRGFVDFDPNTGRARTRVVETE